MKKIPWALVPAGPLAWKSHQFIVPMLKRIWRSIGVRIEPLYFPQPEIRPGWLAQMREQASALILAPGQEFAQYLRFISLVRDKHELDIPSVFMPASEFNRGWSSSLENVGTLRGSDILVTNCEAEKEMVHLALGRKVRCHTIPLPVDSDVFRPASPESRTAFKRELGLASDDPLVVYSGRVTPYKNIHFLILAFSELKKKYPGAKLFILGSPDFLISPATLINYLNFLSSLVVKSKLEDAVIFHGEQSQPELARYLASCDLHVSPTVFPGEDFGYSVAQGLACGSPTLVTRWGGGNSFVDQGGATGIPVFITRNGPRISVHELANLMLRIMDPVQNRIWRKKAYRYASSQVTQDAAGKMWKSLCLDATHRRGGPARAIRPTKLFREDFPVAYDRKHLLPAKAFQAPSQELFLRICDVYSKGASRPALRKRERYSLDPFFDVETGAFRDEFLIPREIPITAAQREGLRTLADGTPSVAQEWMRGLIESGVVLPYRDSLG